MNRIPITIVAALLLVLMGCGSDKTASKPERAASVAPTTPSVPRVSETTICGILFDSPDQTLQDSVALVNKFATGDGDPTTIDDTKATELKESLDSLALRAPESLEPHLKAEAETMQVLVDARATPVDGQTLNFETFKSSGLEITNVCLPLLWPLE